MKPERASSRVRNRLKDELRERGITQRQLARALAKQTGERWTQSKAGKVLNGDVELKIDDADAIARIAGIFLTEAVRERGLEFYAEMSPSELRMLEAIRRQPKILQAVMMLLEIPGVPELQALAPERNKKGRPLLSDLKKRAEK